jgi:hypothetical protein
MKRILITGLLIISFFSTYCQNLDLVVTASGDSIACKIDSITESAIYFQIKTHGNNKWITAFCKKENLSDFNYNCIDPSEFVFKKGTSIIMGRAQSDYPNKYPGKLSLEKASLDELNFYHTKAKRTKKTGAIITILGSGTILTGIALMSTNKEANGYVGFGMTIIGIGITVIWLPVLITGSSRVKSINKIKNSNYSGITMELSPYSFNNYQAKNLQAGVTLRIRF